jgi:hypothetical protein
METEWRHAAGFNPWRAEYFPGILGSDSRLTNRALLSYILSEKFAPRHILIQGRIHTS